MCLILESYQAHQKQKESYRTDKIPFVFLQGKSRHEASLPAALPPYGNSGYTLLKKSSPSKEKFIPIVSENHQDEIFGS